jgi:hypothetical protein
MLKRLQVLWCERHGHQYREVGRVYAGPEGQAQEILLKACRICGARRDESSTNAGLQKPSPMGEQARLDFLARARRRARRRAARRSG